MDLLTGKVLRACLLPLLAVLALLCPGWAGPALASGADAEYHTPLAGEPLETEVLDRPVSVPADDRRSVTDIMLGGEFYAPSQGNTSATPMFDLFLKRVWDDSRTRDEIAIFYNDLEYDRSVWKNVELVGRFENYTLPGGQKEILNNKEIKETSVEWGTLVASVGPGLRYTVSPYQVDNDLRLQLLGNIGYFYANRTKETGSDITLPPDTLIYGLKLRGRYDGMLRNILELPHKGFAAGFDLDYMHRDRWSDFGTAGSVFRKQDTQSYSQFTGYIMAAGGIPGLSERNRFLVSLHGGTTRTRSADRFNAMQIGGGPLPNETDDLCRPDYPGTRFNAVLVSNYALAALEYRRELLFFMYLHLRESLIWADRATLLGREDLTFRNKSGYATTVGVDTGFFWGTELSVDYSWDSGFIRNGRPGSGILVMVNKSL